MGRLRPTFLSTPTPPKAHSVALSGSHWPILMQLPCLRAGEFFVPIGKITGHSRSTPLGTESNIIGSRSHKGTSTPREDTMTKTTKAERIFNQTMGAIRNSIRHHGIGTFDATSLDCNR